MLGGIAPYWTTWTYDAAGNRLSQVKHATTAGGDTTSTYSYPAAGAAHPHGVQSVTTAGPAGSKLDGYTYDAAGNTQTRTLAGVGETLTWDGEGHLASHTKGGQTTSFLYSADGGRLIRREPGAVTLYLDNAEIKLNTTTNTLASTRTYVFNGDTVAVRTSNGTALGDLKLLISDHQGTADLSVDAVTGVVARRRFTPFGETRGTAPLWPSQRGFVGGVNDATTGLTHLGAREYDASIGRFISVDPVLDLANPQQLQGYSYTGNSPVTASDPTGLITDGCAFYGYCSGYSGGGTGSTAPANPVGSSQPSSGGDRSWSDQPSSSNSQQKADAAAKLAALAKARAAREAQKQRLIAAAKALLKIAADELGITAALDCFSSGNLGACAETALTVVSSFAGGLAGKLMAKYGSPWRWAKGARLVKTLWKIGGEAIDAVKGWFKAGKQIEALEDAAASAVHAERNVVEAMADSCPIGNSFTPDTQVLMADGKTKPIADVKVGDKVLATDPATGRTTAKPVAATIIGDGTKHLVDLTLDGHVVTATDGHPFWVPTKHAWIEAGKLQPGDQLLTPTGALAQVASVHTWTALTRVNNLAITSFHTYYVHTGTTDILVHNCGTGGSKPGPKPAGTGPHNLKIAEVAGGVTDGEVIAGGQTSLREAVIETTGGLRGSRRPDILALRADGSRYGINVGKKSVRTGAPYRREAEAINDLEEFGDLEMHFVAYNE